MFKNIVVIFITHKTKVKPFFVGLGLAKKFDADLTVVECLYKSAPKFHFFETKSDKNQIETQKKEAKKSLEKLEKIAGDSGISIRTKIAITNSIPAWIIEYIHSKKVDLLIIDHPALSEFEETHYDDIIQSVSHKVKVPLLLLKS
ncbi:MAG TPA: universal stress protein [Candidatus Nitrosotenuis sp.]|nr:universal stress protein [Candidatus Nitrosotenuis sp.]